MQDYLSYILSLCNLLNGESSMKKYRKLTHNGLARQFSYRSWLCSWKRVGWLVLVYCLICRHPDLWFGAHGETTSLNSPMDLLLDRNGSTSLSFLWINSVIINGVGVFDPFGCKPFTHKIELGVPFHWILEDISIDFDRFELLRDFSMLCLS